MGVSSVKDNQNSRLNPFEVLEDQASDDSSTTNTDRPCEKCGGTINEDVKALQCEFCANWVCLVCSEVPEKMYDIFIDALMMIYQAFFGRAPPVSMQLSRTWGKHYKGFVMIKMKPKLHWVN